MAALGWAIAIAGPAAAGWSSEARAGADKVAKRRAKRARLAKKRQRSRKTKVCKVRKGKRRCSWVQKFDGHAVGRSRLRGEPLPKPSGDLHLYAVNFREEIELNIYDERGQLDDAALAQLDRHFRCRRTREERAVDPRLFEVLSIIYDHFGRRRIELVSGFRFQQNESSRHFHAAAMDIRIPGVSTKQLYEFAESLDTGGMGIGLYPHSGFVHIDFRAPGEKSFRWTDYSRPGGKDRGKKPSRHWKRRSRRPNT